MSRARTVCRHESGHALVAHVLGGQVQQIHVWFDDRGVLHGRTLSALPPTLDAMAEATIEMAGFAATPDRWPLDDAARATALVGPDRIREAADRAARLLAGHDAALDALVEALLDTDTGALDGPAATALLRAAVA